MLRADVYRARQRTRPSLLLGRPAVSHQAAEDHPALCVDQRKHGQQARAHSLALFHARDTSLQRTQGQQSGVTERSFPSPDAQVLIALIQYNVVN